MVLGLKSKKLKNHKEFNLRHKIFNSWFDHVQKIQQKKVEDEYIR